MATQWRVGVNGRTGLDYAALPAVMDWHDIDDRRSCFDAIREMEDEALRLWTEQRERQQH